MAEAISLTDSELRAVMDAAAPLGPGQRDARPLLAAREPAFSPATA
jgi:hypothetical protein